MVGPYRASILVLTLLLSLNLHATQSSPKPALKRPRPTKLTKLQAKLNQARPGIPIEIKLRSHEKVRGLVKEAGNESITIRVLNGDNFEDRKIATSDLKSLKVVNSEYESRQNQFALAGLATGVAALVLIILH